jgi:hypothetical protein
VVSFSSAVLPPSPTSDAVGAVGRLAFLRPLLGAFFDRARVGHMRVGIAETIRSAQRVLCAGAGERPRRLAAFLRRDAIAIGFVDRVALGSCRRVGVGNDAASRLGRLSRGRTLGSIVAARRRRAFARVRVERARRAADSSRGVARLGRSVFDNGGGKLPRLAVKLVGQRFQFVERIIDGVLRPKCRRSRSLRGCARLRRESAPRPSPKLSSSPQQMSEDAQAFRLLSLKLLLGDGGNAPAAHPSAED